MKQHILDDLTKIQKLDPQNMLYLVKSVPQQCRDARNSALFQKLKLDQSQINALIVCGVGGSAISGEMIENYLRFSLKISVVVTRDYDLPAWADQKTLVVCSSHSGDTEETLCAFKQALSRKMKIVVITSGGTLLKEARKHKLPYYEMPAGVQPRTMMNYSFITLLTMLESLKLLPSAAKEIEETISLLEDLSVKYGPFNPARNNLAKQLAEFFYEKIPVIYANASCFSAAVYRWKCQFNENSKQMAWANVFSEMNHNEILAYTHHDLFVKNAAVLLIRSEKYDSARIHKRFEGFKKIVGSKTKNVKEVWVEGESLLSQTLLTIYLGDFVSVYLAFLKGLNPTPIGLIDQLKTKLKR
jgi:glucose/mannose-6-phosphate isomerase